jgi:hypothetical protein
MGATQWGLGSRRFENKEKKKKGGKKKGSFYISAYIHYIVHLSSFLVRSILEQFSANGVIIADLSAKIPSMTMILDEI